MRLALLIAMIAAVVVAATTAFASTRTAPVVVRICPPVSVASRIVGLPLALGRGGYLHCAYNSEGGSRLLSYYSAGVGVGFVGDSYATLKAAYAQAHTALGGASHRTWTTSQLVETVTLARTPEYGSGTFETTDLSKRKDTTTMVCAIYAVDRKGLPVRIDAGAAHGSLESSVTNGRRSAYHGSLSAATICGWAARLLQAAR